MNECSNMVGVGDVITTQIKPGIKIDLNHKDQSNYVFNHETKKNSKADNNGGTWVAIIRYFQKTSVSIQIIDFCFT